jgi:hypothetical protein
MFFRFYKGIFFSPRFSVFKFFSQKCATENRVCATPLSSFSLHIPMSLVSQNWVSTPHFRSQTPINQRFVYYLTRLKNPAQSSVERYRFGNRFYRYFRGTGTDFAGFWYPALPIPMLVSTVGTTGVIGFGNYRGTDTDPKPSTGTGCPGTPLTV